MTEHTNRNEVRAAIAAGGWIIVWGDLINEWDVVTLVVSIPTGSVGAWVTQQVQAQVQKFGQSLNDVSDDVVKQATDYLTELLHDRRSGERDINGLGVKAGIATYHRSLKGFLGSTPLPNNHQPYIGLRITKPLPARGSRPGAATAAAAAEPVEFGPKTWYRLTNAGTPGSALDIVNDGSGKPSGILQMATIANVSGQHWVIRRHDSSNAYYFSALYQGPGFHLDVYGDDKTRPHLAPAGNYSGQRWRLDKWPNGTGTYKLTNEYSGEELRLDGKSFGVSAAAGDGPTQHWSISAIKPVTEAGFA